MTISYIYKQSNINSTKSKINAAVEARELPKIVTYEWLDNQLDITFNKAGVSIISLILYSEGDDSVLKESKRVIALLHKPFITTALTIVEQIIEQSGGVKYST